MSRLKLEELKERIKKNENVKNKRTRAAERHQTLYIDVYFLSFPTNNLN